ncbi:MAG: ribosomal RNA small subunit methyltransferase A [Deltaproteobacteria bacterium]|nr:ribosomal RNA small subunit methyltransferase A [Deltaproteobacteria bacterium]
MTSPRIILNAYNIRAKKKLGQHFLSDPSTARMIVNRGNITPEDVVLEIGAGLGALTLPASYNSKKVFAVEKDRQILDLLKTQLLANDLSNVVLMDRNILDIDIKTLADEAKSKIVVIGNLPYNISSQILVKLIESRKYVSRAILMFQKELAQRITASPGSKDYSRLSVMLQYCAGIKSLATVKANLFFPKPKVDSEVLEIKFKGKPDFLVSDELFLFEVIKAAFGKRRKTLKNALSNSLLQIDVKTVLDALKCSGVDSRRRAETLTVSEFVKLSNCLNEVLDS